MSFSDKLKSQQEQNKEFFSKGGNDWFSFEEGANLFRVLTEPEMFFEKFKVGLCYTDCGYEGTAKFMCFVLDRKDNKIKLAKLPYGVGTTIGTYENDVEFGHEFNGFPMPYDIRVTAKGAHTKEVDYKVDASPRRSDLPEDIAAELAKKNNVNDILNKMKDKQKEKHVADGTWQAEQDRKAKLKTELDTYRNTSGNDEGYMTQEEVDEIPF